MAPLTVRQHYSDLRLGAYALLGGVVSSHHVRSENRNELLPLHFDTRLNQDVNGPRCVRWGGPP